MSEASGHPIGNGQSINVSNQHFQCCGSSYNDNNDAICNDNDNNFNYSKQEKE